MQLLEAYCLPILANGLDSVRLSKKQISELNVCWNNTYRKIFGYNRHESVKLLLCCLQRLDFKRSYDLKRLLFLKRVKSSSNSVIKCVLPFELCSSTTLALLCEYSVCLNWSVALLRHSVNNVYCELVGFS